MADAPLTVSYGVGVDSTGMLVAMKRRGIRPDVILTADTGCERPESYAYLPVISAWLERVGFPAITVVKNPRPASGDVSLAAACLRTGVLPALAYGRHQCSLVWKIEPQERHLRRLYGWNGRTRTWADGVPHVVKAIGYDSGPRDRCRAGKSHGKDSPGFLNWYPLIEWDIDREACEELIRSEGLPVPVKSACFCCPAMKPHEVDELARTHPLLARMALRLEQAALERGLASIKGLGRRWNWREHLETHAPADIQRRLGLGAADKPDSNGQYALL